MNDKESFHSIFQLAGIIILREWELVDGYDPDRGRSWYLFQTAYGLIKIGWRKRVINIDWSDTGVKAIVTEDNVTKELTFVHAYSDLKAIEYLRNLKSFLDAKMITEGTVF